jgi:hypothetical protein
VLYAYIHCFCAEVSLVLHGASKTIRCCILGGVYQMRVARP